MRKSRFSEDQNMGCRGSRRLRREPRRSVAGRGSARRHFTSGRRATAGSPRRTRGWRNVHSSPRAWQPRDRVGRRSALSPPTAAAHPPPGPRRRRWCLALDDAAGRPASAALLYAWRRDCAPVLTANGVVFSPTPHVTIAVDASASKLFNQREEHSSQKYISILQGGHVMVAAKRLRV